jgi:hypothetical protein
MLLVGLAAAIAAAALCLATGSSAISGAVLFAGDLWMGLALGAAGLLASWHILGGRWGRELYTHVSGLAMTIPLAALAWLVELPVLDHVFPWAASAGDSSVAAKLSYLNTGFFALRTILIVLLWCVGAWFLGLGQRPPERTRPVVGAVVGILLAITVTLASTDWILSLEPARESTGFGLVAMASAMLAAFACALRLRLHPRAAAIAPPEVQTLAQILLGLLIIWIYVVFFEYLVAWSGDLPADAVWYDRRGKQPWGLVAWIFVIVGAAGPFFALLSASWRQSHRILRVIAGCILVGQALFAAWLILPDAAPGFVATCVALLAATALAFFGFAVIRYRSTHPEISYG